MLTVGMARDEGRFFVARERRARSGKNYREDFEAGCFRISRIRVVFTKDLNKSYFIEK